MSTHNIAFGNDPAPLLELEEKRKAPLGGHCRLLICCQVCRGQWLHDGTGPARTVCHADPMFGDVRSVLSGSTGALSLLQTQVLVPEPAPQRSPRCFLCGLHVYQGVNGPFSKCYSSP